MTEFTIFSNHSLKDVTSLPIYGVYVTTVLNCCFLCFLVTCEAARIFEIVIVDFMFRFTPGKPNLY